MLIACPGVRLMLVACPGCRLRACVGRGRHSSMCCPLHELASCSRREGAEEAARERGAPGSSSFWQDPETAMEMEAAREQAKLSAGVVHVFSEQGKAQAEAAAAELDKAAEAAADIVKGGGAPKLYSDPAAGVVAVLPSGDSPWPPPSWDLRPPPPPTAAVEEPRIIHEFMHTSNHWTEPRKMELAIKGSGESVVRFAGGAWHGSWREWEGSFMVYWHCKGQSMLPQEPRTYLPIPGTSCYSRGCRDPASQWYEVLHPVVPQV
jgi:hypothetical protein